MNFRISHILAATTGIAVLLAGTMFVFSPLIRMSRKIDAVQYRIINEFDHFSIRDAAIELLSDATNREVCDVDIPEAIAKTEPKFVSVADGTVQIEYGGGFAHYGLIIDKNVRPTVSPSGDMYYKEKRLIKDVYFYESE